MDDMIVCMLRGTACRGSVRRYTQTARSFGVKFTTHAVLCDEHAARLGNNIKKQEREIDKKLGRQLTVGERRLEWS